ncbi:ATP-binding protein [Treponema primitia]|uniref:ATP-binding protein n=1 Tax=Treponema primitia TaxID=88058 RepID=UPI0003098F37|nr:ATP-binding protein [Treponema primitia]
MIRRELYLEQLQGLIGKPFIKVLTGIRRSGKSSILALLKEELSISVGPGHIIYFNLEVIEGDGFPNAEALHTAIIDRIKDDKTYYIFLDEIQNLSGWERVVNSLFASKPVDIYITGSNSRLLSSELATLLAGRYVEIPIRTLSFREYLQFKAQFGDGEKDPPKAVWDYIKLGGFPALHIAEYDDASVESIIKDIYASVLLRDTIQRHHIRNIDLLERIIRFLLDNTGNLFSARTITAYMKHENRKADVETVYNYIHALESAFIIKKAPVYDIRGRGHLAFREKYYPGDISLIYAALDHNFNRISGILESIIFTELERRGYDVYVGKLDNREIDFIGIRGAEKIYVQAVYLLGDNKETIDREFGAFKGIQDNYPKYVVSLDERWSDNIAGIRRLHLADFLLGPY